MLSFTYKGKELLCDGAEVSRLAEEYGTPLYIYSAETIRRNVAELREAFAEISPLICYAIKANNNRSICKLIREQGTGFDVTSGGELFLALKAGADPKKVCYAGVGKTESEIEFAIKSGILMFNIESEPELARINKIAGKMKKKVLAAIRFNPDVDANTHAHTTTGKKGTKFGLDEEPLKDIFARRAEFPNVKLEGIHLHIGSPILTPEPYDLALAKTVGLIEELRRGGAEINWLDVGGGYGIAYKGGETASPKDYARAIIPHIKRSGCRAIIEPGRFIVGNAGILVTRVQYIKNGGARTFVICDAGMTDLIRPALYDSFHRVWPAVSDEPLPEKHDTKSNHPRMLVDIVGPICESGDYFAKNRSIPPVKQDSLLAIFSAGAYGFSMSSNYNSRPRACEILIDAGASKVIRGRQTYDNLISDEQF